MVSPLEFGGAVSGCRTCCGLWLDNEASVGAARGTLHPAVVELAARVDAHVEPVQHEGGAYRVAPAALGEYRRCPQCGAALSATKVSRARIALDVCAAHGTWFDRHELRTLLNALAIERAERGAERERQEVIDADRLAQPKDPVTQLTYDVIDWALRPPDSDGM
jgi:Zn-finger nucleic acid-binding protein